MSLPLLAILIEALSLAAMALLALTAPEGFQDHDGYHAGRPE